MCFSLCTDTTVSHLSCLNLPCSFTPLCHCTLRVVLKPLAPLSPWETSDTFSVTFLSSSDKDLPWKPAGSLQLLLNLCSHTYFFITFMLYFACYFFCILPFPLVSPGSTTERVHDICLRRERGKKQGLGGKKGRRERRKAGLFDKRRGNCGRIVRGSFMIRTLKDYIFKG